MGRSGAPRAGVRGRDEGSVDRAAGQSPRRNGVSPSADPVPGGHAFAVVSTEAELIAAAVPYLEAGLRAGDVVAVAALPETAALIRRQLGTAAAGLTFDARITLPGARAPDVVSVC